MSGNGAHDLNDAHGLDDQLLVIGARLEGYLEKRHQRLKPAVFTEGRYRDLWTVLASLSETPMFHAIADDVVRAKALDIFARKGAVDEARVERCMECAALARAYTRGRIGFVTTAVERLVRGAAVSYLAAIQAEAQTALQRAETQEEMAEVLQQYIGKQARLLRALEGRERSLPTREIFGAAFSRLEMWMIGEEEDGDALTFHDFPRLQAATGGLFKDSYVSIIADTKSGKTTFVSALMLQLARQGRGLLVPTEMSGELFIARLAADLMGTTLLDLRNGNHPPDLARRYGEVRKQLDALSSRIVVLEGAAQKPEDIRQKVEDMLQESAGCRWVIVDGGSVIANRLSQLQGVLAYTRVSNTLQGIAAGLNVPVIATWQIGRKVNPRNGAREPLEFVPGLHDANWSSAIEQDSSLVLGLLYYDSYVRRGVAEPAPHVFPPGALTVHILASRYGGVNTLGTYTAYRKTDHGLIEIGGEARADI